MDTTQQDERLYTLPDLVARVGGATEEDALSYLEGATKAALIKDGTSVVTTRIDTDTARLYGVAADFFAQAAEDQLDALPTLTERFLRTAVWAAHQGSLKYKARSDKRVSEGAAKDGRINASEEAGAKGKGYRNLLVVNLRTWCGQNSNLLHKLETADGTADKPLADALDDLIAFGRELLKSTDSGIAKRRKDSRLDKAWLDKAAKLAKEVRETAKAAGSAMPITEVAQADVDYWDGINLALLGQLIDLFEAGHQVDPTVPRLVPIALRTYFSPKKKAKPAPEKPTGPAAPPADKPAPEKPTGPAAPAPTADN